MPKPKWTHQLAKEDLETATWQEWVVICGMFLVLGAMLVRVTGVHSEEQMIQDLISHSVEVGSSTRI